MDVELKNWRRKELPKAELIELITLAQSGDIEARNKIIEENVWIIGTVNLKYGNTEDGFQQGIFGLIEAIEKYNLKTNTKFSTYAYYWVKQKIDMYVKKDIYKVNTNIIALYKKMNKFIGTKEEFYKKNNIPKKTILALERINSKGEYELTKEYDMKDTNTLEEIDKFLLKEYINNILKKYCTEKEEYIVRKIFFCESEEKELAKELGCTRQYINSEKKRILSKLRGVIINENNFNRERKRLFDKSIK